MADITPLLLTPPLAHRPKLQDVEPGYRAGDRSSKGPSQQRGLHQVLQPLGAGVLRVHLLHQGVGHPGLSQVHSDSHVSPSACPPGAGLQQTGLLTALSRPGAH